MSVLDTLITDRSQSDVAYYEDLRSKYITRTITSEQKVEWDSGLKGTYNASDVNRVESAVAYLQDAVNGLPLKLIDYMNAIGVAPDVLFQVPYEYPISLETYTNWQRAEDDFRLAIDRYLGNIKFLRGVLELPDGTPDVPIDIEQMTYQEANNIETILLAVNTALIALEELKKSLIDLVPPSWRRCGTFYANQEVILP